MTQPRSSLFQYLDQQVAKDMAGFYTAFGMPIPIPVNGDKHMAKKEMKWCDAVGKTIYTGDWVAYLIPNARRLTMGPVMRGTASSVTVLEIAGSNRESSGAKWDLETTISRPFNIVVKIETPWDFIEKSLDQRSGFCAGIDLARKELQAMVLTNTHHTFDTFDLDAVVAAYVDKEFPQQSFVGAHWYNTPNFLETREQMIEIVRGGFNWYKKTNWDVF